MRHTLVANWVTQPPCTRLPKILLVLDLATSRADERFDDLDIWYNIISCHQLSNQTNGLSVSLIMEQGTCVVYGTKFLLSFIYTSKELEQKATSMVPFVSLKPYWIYNIIGVVVYSEHYLTRLLRYLMIWNMLQSTSIIEMRSKLLAMRLLTLPQQRRLMLRK